MIFIENLLIGLLGFVVDLWLVENLNMDVVYLLVCDVCFIEFEIMDIFFMEQLVMSLLNMDYDLQGIVCMFLFFDSNLINLFFLFKFNELDVVCEELLYLELQNGKILSIYFESFDQIIYYKDN